MELSILGRNPEKIINSMEFPGTPSRVIQQEGLIKTEVETFHDVALTPSEEQTLDQIFKTIRKARFFFPAIEFQKLGIEVAPLRLPFPSSKPPLVEQLKASLADSFSRPKRPEKLPRKAISILKKWLHSNRRDPYPSPEQKQELAEKGGISVKQVSTWFMNTRSRKKMSERRSDFSNQIMERLRDN
eukprot:TRINITY_DN20355_c0_g1_i1.p1 TRINITY_DN20355_c0_g1~~TRINITY_DN20355_c0_g1_i1.p1  ORF type:complete len:186 (-),score=24.99 TRINITY_DN20355_c0_g1_i1:55-612(-)